MSLMKLSFVLAGLIGTAPLPAQVDEHDHFLSFPMATDVSTAEVPALAWLLRQGDDSSVMFARAPNFKPVKLFARADVDGQPVTRVQISPNGKFIAVQTGVPVSGSGDAFNPASLIEAPKPTLWLIPTEAGANPVEIGFGGLHSFSPDGKRMLFRQGRDLWSVDLVNLATKPMMVLPSGAGFRQPIWTNDGRTMIFLQDRGGWSFLGRYTLGDDRVRWLVTGPNQLSSPVFSPDGRTVAYLQWPAREHTRTYDLTDNQPFAVQTVDVDTGQVRTLHEAEGKAGTQYSDDPEGHLRWADDRNIIFRSEEDGWARLYAIARVGGNPRALTPPDCEVAESELAGRDTLFIIHNCRNLDTRQLSRVTVSSAQEDPIASDDIVLGLASAVGDGRYIAFTGSNAQDAPLLRVFDLASGKLVLTERPSDHGYSYRFEAPSPQVVRFKASDGGTVSAQLFLPRTKGPHPALVYVHGGPIYQMFPGFHYEAYFAHTFAMNRRLAELGYIILSVNYRSGTGYGRAFREAPDRGWRNASEYRDVLGAGRWLAQRDDVDHQRIGIWGGSYGGLLTGQALARNSDLFKAGVAVHGVFDWSWSSPTPGHQNPFRVFGVGEQDKPTAFRSSPLGAIDSWKSPVLLFSGDRDMNVDVLETIDLHQKLNDRGVDVRTVIVPGEAHVMIRHSSWVELWKESRRFFHDKLGQ